MKFVLFVTFNLTLIAITSAVSIGLEDQKEPVIVGELADKQKETGANLVIVDELADKLKIIDELLAKAQKVDEVLSKADKIDQLLKKTEKIQRLSAK